MDDDENIVVFAIDWGGIVAILFATWLLDFVSLSLLEIRVASGSFNELISVFCEEERMEGGRVVRNFFADFDIVKEVVNVRTIDAAGDIFRAFVIVDLNFACTFYGSLI